MINLIKKWVGPKAGLRLVMRGRLTVSESMDLQAHVRTFNLKGWLQIVPFSHTLMELEGSKAQLDALIFSLQRLRFSLNPTVLEINWRPYKGEFITFRVAI